MKQDHTSCNNTNAADKQPEESREDTYSSGPETIVLCPSNIHFAQHRRSADKTKDEPTKMHKVVSVRCQAHEHVQKYVKNKNQNHIHMLPFASSLVDKIAEQKLAILCNVRNAGAYQSKNSSARTDRNELR